MIILRLLCAVMTAWAFNWALGRPVAEPLLTEFPIMRVYGPIAAALVGFFILSRRAGNGLIVGFFNGVWVSIVSIVLTVVLYLTVYMIRNFSVIGDFDSFMRVLLQEAAPLVSAWVIPLLIGYVVIGSAVAGLVIEVLHWVLSRAKSLREGEEEVL